jgi:hypothetical protein
MPLTHILTAGARQKDSILCFDTCFWRGREAEREAWWVILCSLDSPDILIYSCAFEKSQHANVDLLFLIQHHSNLPGICERHRIEPKDICSSANPFRLSTHGILSTSFSSRAEEEEEDVN